MIDITFDFRSDAKGKDPDAYSPTLNAYHKILWSKKLPNGEIMDLQSGRAPYALRWKEFWFSSDTIIVEMTHLKNKKIIDQVRERFSNFDVYCEHLLHRSYTIGSMVIFPVHVNSMNQRKGTNLRIADRWDLTMECIRRHYAGEESPLSNVIESDKAFYDLFVDFKGYVDFFFLQDCVSSDYSEVDLWLDTELFETDPFPHDADEYVSWIRRNLEFVERRNGRIGKFLSR
jgi:hypothetical protein